MRLQCSHIKSKYHVDEAISLSATLVPIVVMRTVEMEYLGAPYTQCMYGTTHNEVRDDVKSTTYDQSICVMLRKVESIIKSMLLFLEQLVGKYVKNMNPRL